MSKNKFILFTLLVLILYLPKINHAADFYGYCLLPTAFGNENNEVILTPLNRECQRICRKECEAFSRKFKPYAMLKKNSPYAETYVRELNEDVILDCYSHCQKGGNDKFEAQYFEAFQATCEDEKKEDIFYRICVNKDYEPDSGCTKSLECNPNDDKGFISFYKTLQDKVSVGMMCFSDIDNAYNAVETEFDAQPGDKFNLNLAGGATQNQLFMCGKKHINVEPIFNKSPESANTNVDDWFKFRWKNKKSHRHLSTLDDQTFESLKVLNNAKNFWNRILQDEKLATSYVGWGARNPNFFDTGINVQNGDILSIAWKGNYSYKRDINLITNNYSSSALNFPERQLLITKCLWDDFTNNSSKENCKTIWYYNSYLKIKEPTDSNGIYIQNSNTPPSRHLDLFGEDFRKGRIEKFGLTVDEDDKSKIEKDANTNQQYGLEGRVTDENLIKEHIVGRVEYGDGKVLSCKCESPEDQNEGCKNRYYDHHCINKQVFKAGQGMYSLSGKLSAGENFKNRSKLALMHYDGYTTNVSMFRGWYTDNTGGYELSIDLEWLS